MGVDRWVPRPAAPVADAGNLVQKTSATAASGEQWMPPRREGLLLVGDDVFFAEFVDQGVVVFLDDLLDVGAVKDVGGGLLDQG